MCWPVCFFHRLCNVDVAIVEDSIFVMMKATLFCLLCLTVLANVVLADDEKVCSCLSCRICIAASPFPCSSGSEDNPQGFLRCRNWGYACRSNCDRLIWSDCTQDRGQFSCVVHGRKGSWQEGQTATLQGQLISPHYPELYDSR